MCRRKALLCMVDKIERDKVDKRSAHVFVSNALSLIIGTLRVKGSQKAKKRRLIDIVVGEVAAAGTELAATDDGRTVEMHKSLSDWSKIREMLSKEFWPGMTPSETSPH